jgi:hypothetical protein
VGALPPGNNRPRYSPPSPYGARRRLELRRASVHRLLPPGNNRFRYRASAPAQPGARRRLERRRSRPPPPRPSNRPHARPPRRQGGSRMNRHRNHPDQGARLNLTGGGRRPHRANHHADGPGHTSRIGVLGRANGAAIHAPCVLAPLGPALAIAAPVPAGSPSTAVTATATAKTA